MVFKLLLGMALLCGLGVYGQNPTVASTDIVRIKAAYEKEALYFYTQNWLAFRKAAMDEGHIVGYEMQKTQTDSTQHFHLILVTRYADSAAYAQREEHFAPIMKRLSPSGPKMLNSVPRKEFLEYVMGFDAAVVATAGHKEK